MESITREMQNTPTFTTATACSRALTGVGATMAEGSQLWNGMMAALAKPKMNRTVGHGDPERVRGHAGKIAGA